MRGRCAGAGHVSGGMGRKAYLALPQQQPHSPPTAQLPLPRKHNHAEAGCRPPTAPGPDEGRGRDRAWPPDHALTRTPALVAILVAAASPVAGLRLRWLRRLLAAAPRLGGKVLEACCRRVDMERARRGHPQRNTFTPHVAERVGATLLPFRGALLPMARRNSSAKKPSSCVVSREAVLHRDLANSVRRKTH